MRALVSVYDKSGISDFLKGIQSSIELEVISTGGTYEHLKKSGIDVINLSSVTKFPEILDGRVKSLHPKIYGGILFNRKIKSHYDQIKEHNIDKIDIVICNLYPFQQIISEDDFLHQDAIENIDIGGPSMIRAASKNYSDVLVIVDPADYNSLLTDIVNSDVSENQRSKLAAKAFKYTSNYDLGISKYFEGNESNSFQTIIDKDLSLKNNLRYGENPHQNATIYSYDSYQYGIANAEQLNGKKMSYSNYLDADSAYLSANNFERNCVSIVKHTNPCGLSVDENQTIAFTNALSGDPVSAFGGIIGLNSEVSLEVANLINQTFFEIVVAPSYNKLALKKLKEKKSLRILKANYKADSSSLIRSVSGGLLIQDNNLIEDLEFKCVTEKKPTENQLKDILFSWKLCSFIKSNAIVLAKNKTLIGMGAGQPNRIMSVKIAGDVAGKKSSGCILASDAFFPFPDAVEIAVEFGVSCIVQPGGSINDRKIIEVANKNNISMVFTGQRRFLH